MSASLEEVQPLNVKPLIGGLSDKSRSILTQPNEFAEVQNISLLGRSAKKRLGVIPFVRTRPKGYALQMRSDVQPMGTNSGNQQWDSYVVIPQSESLVRSFNTTTWTIEAICYLDKHSVFADQEIFTKAKGVAGTKSIRIYIGQDGGANSRKLVIEHRDSAGALVTIVYSTIDFPTQSERLITVRRGGTLGTDPTAFDIFLDGVFVAGGPGALSSNPTQISRGAMMFGKSETGTGGVSLGYDFGFFGRIGEMRLWSVSRSNANILANIRRQIDLDNDATGLIVYYPLNRDSRYELVDESSHGHAGFTAPYIPRTTKLGSPQKQAYFFDGFVSTIRIPVSGKPWDQMAKNWATATGSREFFFEIGWTPGDLPSTGLSAILLDARNLCEVSITSAGKVVLQLYNGAAVATSLTSTTTLNLGQRYMISVGRSAAQGYLHINGVAEAGSPFVATNTADITSLNSEFVIGAENDGLNGYRNHALGYLDEFRVWCRDIHLTSLVTNVDKRLSPGFDQVTGAEGQFLDFQNTKRVRVTDSSTAMTTPDAALQTFDGIFNTAADVKSLVVFPDQIEGTNNYIAMRHINAAVSATQLTLTDAYTLGDAGIAPAFFPARGAQFTKLIYWIDCTQDLLDPDVYELNPTPSKNAVTLVWLLTSEAGIRFDPRWGATGPKAFPEAMNTNTVTSIGLASPLKLLPKFSQGFFSPEETAISGAHYWKRSDGSRFMLAAAGRSIYWVDGKWSRLRPFAPKKDPSGFSLKLLRLDSIRIPNAANKGIDFGAGQTMTFEAWINPFAVDGINYIASKSTAASIFEYAISVQDGKLVVNWHSNAGANQVTISSASSVIHPNRWQHFAIEVNQAIGAAAIYVNGILVDNVVTGSIAGAASTNTNDLYFGKNPVNSGRGYFGYIDEVRMSRSVRYSGQSFIVPQAPFSDDASTSILMHFDEGQDVFCADSGTLGATVKAHGELLGENWIPLISDLDVGSLDSPSHFSSYRDRVYRTDGINYPIRIDFSGDLADLNLGFTTTRMGIRAPSVTPVALVDTHAVNPADSYQAGDVINFAYTYVNTVKGIESAPSPIGVFTVPGAVSAAQWRMTVVPSADDQVDAIRIYMSLKGGGLLHLVAELSAMHRNYWNSLYNPALIASGDELNLSAGEAPNCKYFRFQKDFCVVANLKDEPTAIQLSQPGDVESFDPFDIIRLDSPKGDPIGALSGAYDKVYAHQKEAIFSISLGDTFDTSIFDLTQADEGAIGGHSVINIGGIDFYRGNSSLRVFNGTNSEDIAPNIQSTYVGRLDDLVSYPGLEQQNAESSYAVKWRRGNQLLWTVRQRGSSRNDRILVRELSVENNPYTLYKGLEYSALIEGEDEDGLPALYGATYTGYVYLLDKGKIDGSSKPRQLDDTASVVTGLVGTAFNGPITYGINVSGGEILDSLAEGYRGAFLTILRRNTAGKITNVTRNRIKSSSLTGSPQLEVEGPFSFTIQAGDTWIVGAIEAYGVIGWLDLGSPAIDKYYSMFDLSFKPAAASLFDFYWEMAFDTPDTLADLFSQTNAQQKRIPMDQGWTDSLLLDNANRARFARFQLYSVDSEVDAEWFGYTLRASSEGVGYGP